MNDIHPNEIYCRCRLNDQQLSDVARDAWYAGIARQMTARDLGVQHGPEWLAPAQSVEPQGESVRLFQPAPPVLLGQTDLGL